MVERQNAMLTIQSNAARHLDKLDRTVRDRFADFQTKFCANMHYPGLRLKRLKSNRGLWSARITDDHRAIMCKVGHAHFALIAVEARGSAYDRLDDRYEPVVNRVTGAFEVMDHDDVRDAVETSTEAPPTPEPVGTPKPAVTADLFEPYTDAELLALGVAEPLMPSIRRITTEDRLEAFCAVAPHHTAEVLRALDANFTLEEVEELITAPVKATGSVDTSDLETAVSREASMVTSSDRAVAAMLEDGFDAWRVWPHPTQKRVIDRDYNGPARVSGGPGTGKTVVALHRAARLARQLGDDERILLTTFTKNLAADLKTKLGLLLDAATMQKVDVEHLDSVVRRLAGEDGRKLGNICSDHQMHAWWDELCREAEETDFDGEFLHGEWTEVVCAQLITSRSEYFQARRVRRPRRLNRLQRARVWRLVERFNERLAAEDAWCWPQLRASVALREEHRFKGRYQYRHIVIDEAQDLTAAHWRLLRALVPEEPDDLFIAGDPFQRIYGQPVTLGKLGIDIRGRSKRLTLNYRTTREILKTALAIADDANADDLDGERDSLAGYRSVMNGAEPRFRPQKDSAAELAEIAEQAAAWTQEHTPGSIAVTVPSNAMVEKVIAALQGNGVTARPLAAERSPGEDAVHVGTMHRLKGLEYRFMMISGIGAEHFPFSRVRKLEETDPQQYELELEKSRNLLFVAATRARDEVVFTWAGTPTALLRLKA